jgi:hypothetical protein
LVARVAEDDFATGPRKLKQVGPRGPTNYTKFAAKYGENVYELEAISPDALQTLVREAIDSVINVKLFNSEIDREKQDAAEIETLRRSVVKSIQERTAA